MEKTLVFRIAEERGRENVGFPSRKLFKTEGFEGVLADDPQWKKR